MGRVSRAPIRFHLIGCSLLVSWVASDRPGRFAAPFCNGNQWHFGVGLLSFGQTVHMARLAMAGICLVL